MVNRKSGLDQQFKHLSKRSVVFAAAVLLGLTMVGWIGLELIGGTERLSQLVRSAGPWAPVVFVFAKASTYVVAPLSGGPLKIVAGALFGFVPGVIYSVIGDLLGGSLNFWLARLIGRPAIIKLSGQKTLRHVDDFVHKIGDWKALLTARILLSAVYDFISYAAGLSQLKYKTYFWVTLIGGIPGSAIAVGTGFALLHEPLLAAGLGLLLVCLVGLYFHLQKATR